MKKKLRVMSERPLNAETPTEYMQSWITPNAVFFRRNQGAIPEEPIALSEWRLTVEGLVENPLSFDLEQILRMPKATVSNTLECSGNGRSLLKRKASGNPWTIGGVGNAVWGGVWLRDLLNRAVLKPNAGHVTCEGFDTPLGSKGVRFIRSIPVTKAMESTLLAHEMNGEPLPVEHGYPLRALALGWTGANCVKWLSKITVSEEPYEGFFMDKVYRVFGEGEKPESGRVVTGISVKSIITRPPMNEVVPVGRVAISGAAYAGEVEIDSVEVSVDNGSTWAAAEFTGPFERFAWRRWQHLWEADEKGTYRILSRATDARGRKQPMNADWNVLGYGNNGVSEHGITVHVS